MSGRTGPKFYAGSNAVFHRNHPTLSRAATGIEPASGHK